jgi:hypothetical protein
MYKGVIYIINLFTPILCMRQKGACVCLIAFAQDKLFLITKGMVKGTCAISRTNRHTIRCTISCQSLMIDRFLLKCVDTFQPKLIEIFIARGFWQEIAHQIVWRFAREISRVDGPLKQFFEPFSTFYLVLRIIMGFFAIFGVFLLFWLIS